MRSESGERPDRAWHAEETGTDAEGAGKDRGAAGTDTGEGHGSTARPGTGRLRLLWAGTALLPLLPLLLFGGASWFARWVRPSGDEWCFLPLVRDEGFMALVDRFYSADNGRVANGVLVASYAVYGVAGQQWYAGISVVVMLALLWGWTAALLRSARWRLPRGIPLFSAAMVLAVFCFASTNTYKTFYWPASSVSHTFPPVLAAAATIPALLVVSRRGKAVAVVSAFVLGAVMGTLSEETSLVALALLAVALFLGRLLFRAERLAFARTWCAAAVLGILVGTAVLLTSPGSRNRRVRHHADSMFAPESLSASLRGYAQVLHTLVTTWQYIGVIAVGVLIGVLVRRTDGGLPRPDRRAPLFVVSVLVALLLAGYVCMVIAYPAFGPSVATANRLWNDFLFPLLLLLVGVGGLLGNLAVRRYRRGMLPVAAGAVLVCVGVMAVLAVSLRDLDGDMRARAKAWDSQDRMLRARAAAGETVLPYKRLVVSKMSEPFGKHPWPASCVATYYHVKKVTKGT
ncbi:MULTISPECIES: DUF6056 family protein [Streptomyces]|uniref:DUF6056 family protein n=1 Tax=Streptomyces TaxID=1883 RepID=UPI0004A8ECE2|nr:DUF6056 family protein [Streptomyces sp. NTK 937]KDQ71303.1 membrane protein [Streptomyces sp. NTK 937]WSX34303.1 DUF6056 family protein [Streptomyces halstedii]